MISLRHKLWFGFGGLLIVLLVVSALSVFVFTRFSHTLERVFRENYDSVVYCQGMKEQLDLLDSRVQGLIWQPGTSPQLTSEKLQKDFESDLQRQINNVSLPLEPERTRQLADLWQQFKLPYQKLDDPSVDRAALYRQDLFPRLQQMKQLAQQIADMNMGNMVSVNGRVKSTLTEVRNALLVLVITGSLLATAVVWTAGAAMLHPISALTRSARQIEAGDLDLTLKVISRDEIGQLADAFNSMAARLREFRRLDHDRLARTQQTTQLAIDSLPDAVFVIGPDEKVEIANLAAKTHFAIEPGVMVRDLSLRWLIPLYESVLRDHKPIEPQGYSAALQLFVDGEERILLPRAEPMLSKENQLIGVTVILVDVTPLRKADEAKSSMVLTVSHELRTPLTGVRMALSMLAGDGFGETTARQKTLIKSAREESDRLNRIIENLLNISRLEAGRAQLQFRPMRASEIIAMAVDPLRPAFAEKKVTLEVFDLPIAADVNVDPQAISSALTNLLSNAMKFTPSGGAVKINCTDGDGQVTFKVTDTGAGIPLQYRDRIFEKFFRVPRSEGPTGAGLGLTIAREIIEAHGGTLGFTSPEAGGTVFSFTLPACDAGV
jgi:NtrC-family two-component system sensor histidine kinase KinB